MNILNYSPGQVATIILESKNTLGVREDSSTIPNIKRIIDPELEVLSGFPVSMTKIDTGLYRYQYTIPKGASAVGTYLIDVEYTNPENSTLVIELNRLNVNAPYGLYSIA